MRRVIACLAAALLLAGCTGTSEPRPPTLLLVGAAPGGVPQLLLIEDVTGTAPPGQPRLVVLPDGSRPLLAPAVALDFEDRGLERQAAWVLTRSVATGGGGPTVSAYLQRFEVTDVDPADPSAFAEDATARLTLTEPGGTGVLDGLSLTSPATCPAALQVDREGTVAVVLDDPSRCGGGDHPELWLVPLHGGTPQALQGTNDVAPLPAYLDQRPDDQVVYFLVDAIQETHVYARRLGEDGSERVAGLRVPEPAGDLRAAAGAGDLLVVLADQDLVTVDLLEPAQAVRAATRAGATALAVDPTGTAPEVLVMDGSVLTFHSDPADGQPDTAQRQSVAAALDPLTRFGYAVGEGRVTIVDLLTGGETDRSFQAYVEPLPELELPPGAPAGLPGADPGPVTVIGWVRAAAPPAP